MPALVESTFGRDGETAYLSQQFWVVRLLCGNELQDVKREILETLFKFQHEERTYLQVKCR
jgi:hypothetical protein